MAPRALALAPDADVVLRGSAAYALGICRGEQGLAAEAIEHCRAAYELLRDGPDPLWAARALNSLASLTHDVGNSAEAAVLLDESIALRRTLDGALPLAIPLGNRAAVAVQLGDAATAAPASRRSCGSRATTELEAAFALMGLADVELLVGDADAAGDCLRAAVETVLSEDYQDYRLMECLESFAALAVVRDRAALAATLIAAVDKAYADEGSVMVPADVELRERRTSAAIAVLSPDGPRAAEARGAALDLQAAVRLATAELLD